MRIATDKKKKMKSGLERDFSKLHPSAKYETTRFPYVVKHHYTPDFQIADNAFVETKGLFTAADRAKHLHIREQHPEVKIFFVFQNPNLRLSKTSSTTYANWCDKHGFSWTSAKNSPTMSLESILNILGQKV